FAWREEIDDRELSALHAAGFDGDGSIAPWAERLERYSLGWVTARRGTELVGFCNVITDGGRHAFLLDVVAIPTTRGPVSAARSCCTRSRNAGRAMSNGCTSTSRRISGSSTWPKASSGARPPGSSGSERRLRRPYAGAHFSPEVLIEATICFWKTKKIARVGSAATVEA